MGRLPFRHHHGDAGARQRCRGNDPGPHETARKSEVAAYFCPSFQGSHTPPASTIILPGYITSSLTPKVALSGCA